MSDIGDWVCLSVQKLMFSCIKSNESQKCREMRYSVGLVLSFGHHTAARVAARGGAHGGEGPKLLRTHPRRTTKIRTKMGLCIGFGVVCRILRVVYWKYGHSVLVLGILDVEGSVLDLRGVYRVL